MARQTPFVLVFDTEVKEHLNSIDTKHHSMIRKTIREQLSHEPDVESRNRKPLRKPANSGATWELRFGQNNRFRVLYSIDVENREVQVLAIGIKVNNRLLIGGEEVEL